MIERKIGEIFEYNGEWCQCIVGNNCKNCAFNEMKCYAIVDNGDPKGDCCADRRKDNKDVIFKKLQKVGEPFERNGYMYQEYKAHTFPLLMNGDAKIPTPNGFAVIIKQNKEEDMKTVRISKDDLNFLVNKIRYGILPKCADYDEITSEITDLFSVEDVNLSNTKKIGKNLKPFDLEAAKSGKPVCTRSGKPVRIICFDVKGAKHPIIALVKEDGCERVCSYIPDGSRFEDEKEWSDDLMMIPEKKEGWVNVYKGDNGISKYNCDDIVFNTKEEATQYAQNDDNYITTVKISWEE